LLRFGEGVRPLRRQASRHCRVEGARHVVGGPPVVGDLGGPPCIDCRAARLGQGRAYAAWSVVRSPGSNSAYSASWTRA
jgi:hypothetical protein